MSQDYPACDPIVDMGHPKCYGTLLPLERVKINRQQVAWHSMENIPLGIEKIWKCSLCAREVS